MAILQSTTVTGSLIISGSQENLVQIIGSGSTLFAVNGASGQLFGVSDDLTDSLFSVNTIAGLPVIEAFADNTVKIGTYGSEELIVSSSQVYITSASLSGPTLFLDGNVGIGTTNPSTLLSLGNAVDAQKVLLYDNNDNFKYGFGIQTNEFRQFYPDSTSARLVFGTISDSDGTTFSEKMRITSTGNVGIGETSPPSRLYVNGPTLGTSAGDYEWNTIFRNHNGNEEYLEIKSVRTAAGNNWLYGGKRIQMRIDSTYMGYMQFNGSGNNYGISFGAGSTTTAPGNVAERMRIQSDGNVGIGTTSPKEKLHVQGNITGSGNLTLEGNAGYPIFESGFGGSGWRVDSSANAEFQNLTVRGTFSVYELLAQQIRATNGSLLVATSGKVESTGSLTLFFDTGSQYGHGFLPGDILLAQRLDPGGGQLKRTFLTVNTVSSTGSLTYKDLSGNPPEAGQEFVRIGSTSSLDRQGHIYLTADDSNAPYIGVRDGVSGSTQFTSGTGSIEKVRMGKLSGITSNTFGALSGYGFWAKGNAYLEGGISATFGDIGGFNITDSAITSSGDLLSLKSNGQITASNALIGGTSKIAGFTVSDTQINSGTNLVLKSSGQITGSNVLFTGGKISGSSLAIDVTTLTAKGNTVEISGSNFHLLNGNVTASNVDLSGNISATTGNIGGFAITSDAITGSGFYLSGSATGTDFFISASNFNVKANGQLTASAAQISGKITAGSGQIGDWIITNESLYQAFTSASTTTFTILGNPDNVPGAWASAWRGIQVGNDGGNRIWLAANENTSNNDYEFVVFQGGQYIVRLGTSGNTIAGWNIDSSAIYSGTKDTSGYSESGITLNSGGSIHTPNFYVDTDGNAFFKGTLSAPGGTIGGFTLSDDALSGTNFYISGSATGNEFFISSSNFNVKANGDVTGSSVLLDGGTVGGFDITSTQINDSSGTDLILKANGQITASAAQITGDITANTGKLFNLDISGSLSIGTGGTIQNDTVTITNSEIKLDSLGTSGASEPDLSLSGSALQIGDDSLGFKGMLYAWADTFATDAIYLDTVSSTGTIAGELKFRSPQIQLSSSLETYIDTPVFTVTGDITGSNATFSGNVGIGTASPSAKLQVEGSGSTLFDIQGSQGQLFSVTDDLTGTLFSVNDISGIPILSVDSDDTVTMGTFGANTLVVTGSLVGIGTATPAANAKITNMGNMTFGIPGNGSNTSGRFISIEGNTDAGGEGSGRIFFTEHNSSTAGMSNYGMSIGYRGGGTSIVGADGNTWTGLASIGNGEWGMWGHDNNATGALIMYGPRSGASITVAGNLFVNNNVGIGTDSPDFALQVATPEETTDPISFAFDITRENSGTRGMTFGMATNDTFGAIGTHNADLQLGHTFSTESNGQPAFYPTLTIQHIDQSVGNVGIGTTSPAEKLTIQGNISASGDLILSNGKGIDFSATSNAGGMTSELLDDYEEGTWTPQWTSGDFDTLTMDTVNATYTKVGNLVTLCAYVRTDLVTLVGNPSTAYMTGVPFQPISNDYFAVNVGYSAGWPGDEPTGGYLLHTSGDGTRIYFHYRTSSNGPSTTLSSTDFGDPSGGNANQLIFTITYHT